MNEQPTYLEIFKDLRKEKESAFYGVEVFSVKMLESLYSVIVIYESIRIPDKTVIELEGARLLDGCYPRTGQLRQEVYIHGLSNKAIKYDWEYQFSMPLCHSSQIKGEYDADRIETNIAILKGVPNIDFVDTELCIKVDGVLWNVVFINGDVALV